MATNSYDLVEWANERGRIHSQMKELSEKAKTEKRAYSEEEDATWGKLDTRYKELLELEKRDKQVQQMEHDFAETEAQAAENRKEAKVQITEGELEKRTMTKFLRFGFDALEPDERVIMQKRGTSTQVTTTDGLGGFAVPEFWHNELMVYMAHYSGMLEAAHILRTAHGGQLNFPYTDETTVKGARITEGTADTVADNTLQNRKLDSYTYTSKVIKVALELIQDSAYALDPYVQRIAAERIGRILNEELTTADGSAKPNGVATAASTGKAAASTTAITRAEIIDLIHSVDRAHRNGPSVKLMMHDSTLSAIKKLTIGSSDDRPLWQPSIILGEPDRLEGYQIVVNNDMDELSTGASSKVMLFGDFSKYFIRLVQDFELVRMVERYADERVIGYFAFLRADGELIDTSAIKALALAAS